MNAKELEALIKLLDDSDVEIYSHVESRLLDLGFEVIPHLEKTWESTLDILLQQRIEELIHKIQFNQVKFDLQSWAISGAFDLLSGFITISKYQYPELDEQKILNQIS